MLDVFGDEIFTDHFSDYLLYELHLAELIQDRFGKTATQVYIGDKPSGTKHIVDVVAIENKILISAKLQNSGGTAEEKIPYEQLMLQHACTTYGYEKAYIVCAGMGWRLLDYYTSDLYKNTICTPNVELITYDSFLELLAK
mgnify:CR=1 FL=1